MKERVERNIFDQTPVATKKEIKELGGTSLEDLEAFGEILTKEHIKQLEQKLLETKKKVERDLHMAVTTYRFHVLRMEAQADAGDTDRVEIGKQMAQQVFQERIKEIREYMRKNLSIGEN